MLSLNNIEIIYSNVILVLKGVSLKVKEGQIVALLGGNGAGKTTTLKAISGLLKMELGEVTDGGIEFEGTRIDQANPDEIVRKGIVQVLGRSMNRKKRRSCLLSRMLKWRSIFRNTPMSWRMAGLSWMAPRTTSRTMRTSRSFTWA